MDLTATKAVVLVLLGMIKLVSGLAPLVFTKIFRTRSERFLKKFIGMLLNKLSFYIWFLIFPLYRNCVVFWRRCVALNCVHPHGDRGEGVLGESHHHGHDPHRDGISFC